MPRQKVGDALHLKNRALLALLKKESYIGIGFDRGQKYLTGRLFLVDFFELDTLLENDSFESKPANIPGDGSKPRHDPRREMLWGLDIYPQRPVAGYEKPERFYFVTSDLEWWAPLTKKESDGERS